MINLLPSAKKSEIRAARTNVILIRYIAIIVLASAFIFSAMYVTHTVLAMTKTSSEEVIASNDLKASVYSATKTQVDTLSSSLTQAKTLLDQEVLYSKVLVDIGQLMPPGTVFDKLALDSSSFSGTPTTTKIYAKTSADVVTLRENFARSPIFTGVNIQTVVETGSTMDGYPVSADITFTLNKAGVQ